MRESKNEIKQDETILMETKIMKPMKEEKIIIDDYEFLIESKFDYRDFGLKKNTQLEILKQLFDRMNNNDSVFIPQSLFNTNSICGYINILKNEYYKDTVIFKRKIIKNGSNEIIGCRVFRIN
jgi:hypothetical protein